MKVILIAFIAFLLSIISAPAQDIIAIEHRNKGLVEIALTPAVAVVDGVTRVLFGSSNCLTQVSVISPVSCSRARTVYIENVYDALLAQRRADAPERQLRYGVIVDGVLCSPLSDYATNTIGLSTGQVVLDPVVNRGFVVP